MATKQSENLLLQQVNQLWGMLDEMSESNPEAYHKFIQHHLGEGMKQLTAPEPHGCFQTRMMEPSERLLYVNLCSWSRVPAPVCDSDPVPLAGGTLEEIIDSTDTYSVTDIAYSPEVLQKASKDPVERDQLIRLAMKSIEEQHCVHLSHSYRLLTQKLKGSNKQMRQRLSGRSEPARGGSGGIDATLLQLLTGLKLAGREQEEEASPIRLPGDVQHPKNPGLIQEISSTEFECGGKVETPKYEVSVMEDENGKANSVELKVELPGVSSVAECDLSVSKDDVVIDVPEKYRLRLNLPETISEDMTSAKFNRKSHVLSVRMPILTK
ncbi:PIH1 domain-containing protein 2 [Pristis pectinata]|uniref:PIH1 domain-containing protein 2 n=1 Tax=Pristis pectinata TaxID=685728 RepID=UPI00223D2645|nr:PIH1 domain-containing protein 2 [Pristis pectinata]